ncbi:MAG: ACT domain-containing protein [Pseudomonadota bacterium]
MTDGPVTELSALLQGMDPVLNPGVWVFAVLPDGATVPAEALGTFREAEGLTAILPEGCGTSEFRAAWITLRVHSALEAVGLTAAVSAALTEAGIPCNVVAAAHHDHLFVPVERAEAALTCLRALQNGAAPDPIS